MAAHNGNQKALRSALSIVRAESSDDLKQTLSLVKETEARTKALFTAVRNQHAEITNLLNEFKRVTGLLAEILREPDKLTEAEHVIRDFIFNKNKK